MSSVEWGASSELTTGGERRPNRLAHGVAGRLSRISDVRARRIAAFSLLATYIIVVVAQWLPWFSIKATGASDGFDLPGSGSEHHVGAIAALNGLSEPYYLGWTLIAVVAAAAIFGTRRIRRTAAGVAAGAIVGQTIVVLAAWHDNGVGLFRSILGDEGGVQGHREIGIYLCVLALVTAAASMVVAVRGRVLPSITDDADTDSVPVDPAAAPVAPVAADRSPAEEAFEPRRPRLGAPVVESAEALGDEAYDDFTPPPVANGRHETSDHSIFMRPRGADAHR